MNNSNFELIFGDPSQYEVQPVVLPGPKGDTPTKTDLGLDKVDNTPDTQKPISELQKQALDKKTEVVETLAALRAVTAEPGKIYYLAQQGIEGSWFVHTADTTSPDNTGTCVIAANGRRLKRLSPFVTPEMFAAAGNGIVDDSDAIQNMLNEACKGNRFSVKLTKPLYKVTKPLTIDTSMVKNQNGLSLKGEANSYRDVKILYSGEGYCLNIIGEGNEGGNPITRYTIENLSIDGDNNEVSQGGFNIKRSYIVKLIDCASVNWAKADSHAVSIRNTFSTRIEGGNYSMGFPKPQGGSCIVIGSENPDPWNTSNVTIYDTLIQRAGGYGVEVRHDGNILDNLKFDMISFGGNAAGSIYINNPNVNNVGIDQCHFESAGYNHTPNPALVAHVDIRQASCVQIGTNEFKDAWYHIKLHQVNAFTIGVQKCFETTKYIIPNSVGISITGTASRYSRGSIAHQNIYSDHIDTPYVIDDYSDVSWPLAVVTEAQWEATYANRPNVYKGAIIKRKDIKAGNADAPYSQLWTSANGKWYRIPLSERGFGWKSSMPTEGDYTAGDVEYNLSPTLAGVNGTRYTVLGWRRMTTGNTHELNVDWAEMRTYYELSYTDTKGGTSVQSGDGVKTSFEIAHGLGVVPSHYSVQAGSSAAKGIAYVTADATKLTVFYDAPIAAGANNTRLIWSVKR